MLVLLLNTPMKPSPILRTEAIKLLTHHHVGDKRRHQETAKSEQERKEETGQNLDFEPVHKAQKTQKTQKNYHNGDEEFNHTLAFRANRSTKKLKPKRTQWWEMGRVDASNNTNLTESPKPLSQQRKRTFQKTFDSKESEYSGAGQDGLHGVGCLNRNKRPKTSESVSTVADSLKLSDSASRKEGKKSLHAVPDKLCNSGYASGTKKLNEFHEKTVQESQQMLKLNANGFLHSSGPSTGSHVGFIHSSGSIGSHSVIHPATLMTEGACSHESQVPVSQGGGEDSSRFAKFAKRVGPLRDYGLKLLFVECMFKQMNLHRV